MSKVYEQIADCIEKSKFYNKYGCKTPWLSGGSTCVYPITTWVEDKEIVIQMNSLVSPYGRTNSFKALYNELAKKFDLREWRYNKNDGSCPPTYSIYYKNINKDVFNELTQKLSAESILKNARRNQENPFGYVIDYIKDMYNLSKTEGWDTAAEICRYFKVQEV